jgi:hypothetical protein
MARGWESKSVEDQIAEREARPRERQLPAPAPADVERETQRQSLQLARARALQDLQGACNPRHRALLQRMIEYLGAEISKLSER